MEKMWITGGSAVAVSLTDFEDPALVGSADVRERGVRLEVRRVGEAVAGSVYASPRTVLLPAVVRVDLLESRPRAADRMHWHPTMTDGEPGDRRLDPAIRRDPLGWTRQLLSRLDDWVGPDDASRIATLADAIVEEVSRLLEASREPWPTVVHDDRGLAGD